MNSKKYSHVFLSVFVLLAGIAIAYGTFAQTATSSVSQNTSDDTILRGITFPIVELGNCTSKENCRTYCNDTSHIEACVSFARAHGLMNSDEAVRAQKFASQLQSGGGPGGCNSPDSCEAFCKDIANLGACVAFAKTHGIKDKELEQGQKISDYLAKGGKTPGGCTSKDACEIYCSDFSHAEECLAFAKAVGIAQSGAESEDNAPTAEEMQKFLSLIKSGETPGGCTSKDACEAYCEIDAHRSECVAFGEKMGFVDHEQAGKILANGGNGPGGCNSSESCRAYCNDQAHYDECLNFGKEHGFINSNEVNQTKDAVVRLRAGLENAPQEVRDCLESTLGSNTLDSIQAGTLLPNSDLGGEVRSCFEKFGHKTSPENIFKNAPSEVLKCLQDKFPDDIKKVRSGAEMPTPQMAEGYRVCFQAQQFSAPQGGSGSGEGGGTPQGFQNFLKNAPQGMQDCLKNALGADFDALVQGNTQSIPGLKDKVQGCFSSFRPGEQGMMHSDEGEDNSVSSTEGEMPEGDMHDGEQGNAPASFQGFRNLPPQIVNCIQSTVGFDALEKIKNGEKPTPDMDKGIRNCLGNIGGGATNPPQGFTSGTDMHNDNVPRPMPLPPLPQNIQTMPQGMPMMNTQPFPPQGVPNPGSNPPPRTDGIGGNLLDAFSVFLKPILGN